MECNALNALNALNKLNELNEMLSVKKVLAVIGPTASGKTKLAIELAKSLEGEIISADSRQVYKYVNIATSYPSLEDLNTVKHYFISELELNEDFNAGQFGKRARALIEDIFSRNKQPVICGGSGLYVRSLIDGFFEDEIESKDIRDKLYQKLESKGEDHLYDELKKVDEESYSKIPKRKIRRVIRALEIYYASGKRMSEFQNKKIEIDFETVQIGLMLDRKYLYKRINERVDEMISNGLIDEVKNLQAKSFDYKTSNSLNTVGIKEVFKYFEGEYDFETMRILIKQNTRRYAKRQMTWFGKDKRIKWINVTEESDVKELTDKAIEIFKQKTGD